MTGHDGKSADVVNSVNWFAVCDPSVTSVPPWLSAAVTKLGHVVAEDRDGGGVAAIGHRQRAADTGVVLRIGECRLRAEGRRLEDRGRAAGKMPAAANSTVPPLTHRRRPRRGSSPTSRCRLANLHHPRPKQTREIGVHLPST